MFGLKVYDENGTVILNSADFTYEVIFNTTLDWTGINFDAEASYTVNGFDPAACVFCIFLETPGAYDPEDGYGVPPLPYIYPVTSNVITLRRSTPGNTSTKSYANGVYRLIAFRML
ncbi:hypothetical protein [Azotobacter beijerinckii]|uniref:hypothetical protein n=1 Tax=Azotobacter beijerinckii TaxID=170623 RepID=UPI002953ED89|nr:hypothetical protein [Azotobacter beijerinckii]MDV7209884.1 hypothetical protein [Azotobacter beijerinckii]